MFFLVYLKGPFYFLVYFSKHSFETFLSDLPSPSLPPPAGLFAKESTLATKRLRTVLSTPPNRTPLPAVVAARARAAEARTAPLSSLMTTNGQWGKKRGDKKVFKNCRLKTGCSCNGLSQSKTKLTHGRPGATIEHQ